MRERYHFLDSIRGLVLISMILYHACWDFVYIFGKKWNWYFGTGAYIWQQSICWTFILLSGFCWSLGRKPGKRGLIVFLAGAVVSLVTILFMPEDRVVFGVLTFRVSTYKNPLIKSPAPAGIFFNPFCSGTIISIQLPINVNQGYLGFEGFNIVKLPDGLYKGWFMTFLGFPYPEFYSTDYFSLIPWIFLFLTGYFFYRAFNEADGKKAMERYLKKGAEPFSFLGKHSLIIYPR